MTAVDESNRLGFLCAIWILACNDEDAGITYAGLRHRLHLDDAVDARQLVAANGELFRRGLPQPRLTAWKEKVRKSGLMPSWLRDIPEGPEREAAIDRLGVNDFFRSQFRAGADAPRSDIQIVDWGLQHLERLHKADADRKEERTKRAASLWVPLASMLVTFLAIGTSAALQLRTLNDQHMLKQYEVSFQGKQQGYSRLMSALDAAYDSASSEHSDGASRSGQAARIAFIQLEPFLIGAVHDRIEGEIGTVLAYCVRVAMQRPSGMDRDRADSAYADFRRQIRSDLYTALF